MEDWRPTRALPRAVGVVCLLLIGGIAAGRPDLVAIALPLTVGTCWALRRRPGQLPRVIVEEPRGPVAEGEELALTASVVNVTDKRFSPVVIGAASSRWLPLKHPDSVAAGRPLATAVPAGHVAEVALRVAATRWGRHQLGPVWARLATCHALLVSRAILTPPLEVRAHPVVDAFQADEAMPRAAGLTGTHRSQRAGQGGELAGVRRFAPGDRLRRIDWRVSLRTSHLHVAETLSDREAEVVLLLDTLQEAGTSGGVRGTASTLDTTVRGAAAVAEHYLQRGDRVSLLDFGPRHRQLRPASGRWQFHAMREWLLDTRAIPGALDPAMWLARPRALPPNALIVAFTPLLDDRSAELLARLARTGRFLIAIDTLPSEVRPDIASKWLQPALRLWRISRQHTIDELREHGVPVVAWRGSGSLDEVLRGVSRTALSAQAAPW